MHHLKINIILFSNLTNIVKKISNKKRNRPKILSKIKTIMANKKIQAIIYKQ